MRTGMSLGVVVLLLAVGCAHGRGVRVEGGIPAAGGAKFGQRVCIEVPRYLQRDAAWAGDHLGSCSDSIGSGGCMVCCVGMVLSSYGVPADPKSLNDYLSQNGGYTGSGLLIWDKALAYSQGQARMGYNGKADYNVLDRYLLNGTPVITKILLRDAYPHWVVVVGKDGYEYLAQDPLDANPPRPLSHSTRRIYQLRVLEPVKR